MYGLENYCKDNEWGEKGRHKNRKINEIYSVFTDLITPFFKVKSNISFYKVYGVAIFRKVKALRSRFINICINLFLTESLFNLKCKILKKVLNLQCKLPFVDLD